MQKIFSLLLISLFSVITLTAYAADAPPAFAITSPAFLDQGALPVLYACDGKNISPEFNWTAAPKKTETFAMILSDPDAAGGIYYHWIVYNIPKSTAQLAEGVEKLPAGTFSGKNSAGKMVYSGPCPPHGQAHTYIATLYALDAKLSLPTGAEGDAVEKALKSHVIEKVTISFVYSRWFK